MCDLERYRTVDTKIIKVLQTCDLTVADTGTVRYQGRLRGIISPPDGNEVALTRWSRVDFTGSQTWVRRLVDFHGWFTCTPTDAGTIVTHGEQFGFLRPAKWLMEPFLRTWLAADFDEEMQRLRSALER